MLNKHNLNIAKCCSPDENRFTLNGIHVTPERTTVTDGHKLITVTTPKVTPAEYPVVPDAPGEVTQTFEPFILPRVDALAIAKAIPQDKNFPILRHAAVYSKSDENGAVYIGVTDLERNQMFSPRKLSGNFPDWTRVMPDQAAATLTISIDARIVRDVMTQYIEAASDKQRPCVVTWRFQDGRSAIRMDGKVGDEQEMTGVVMPMRYDDPENPDDAVGAQLKGNPLPLEGVETEELAALRTEVASLRFQLATRPKPVTVAPGTAQSAGPVRWEKMRNGAMRAVYA